MTNFSSTGPVSGDLLYRGNNGHIGIKEGTAATKPLGFAVINYTYLTDKQSLSVVLGDQGLYWQARTFLYFHSDTGHTEGVYCAIAINGIELGTYTRTGAVYTYTMWVNGFKATVLKQGDNIEIRNTTTTNFVVLVNRVALTLTPTAANVEFDASHRSAMISMERKNAAIDFGIQDAGDYESFRIASLVMSDYVIPPFKGSGAKMKATDATPDTLNASAGNNLIPSIFFTNVDFATDDVTADVSTAKFTALIEGHYKVVLRTKNAIADGASAGLRFAHLLYKNGVVHESGTVMTSGHNGTQVTWQDGLQSTWTIYLAPGDYVQAGYSASATLNNALKQDTDGKENVFSIALLTRNLL